MAEVAHSSYDEVPYVGHPFPQTHPDRLESLGILFGMNPARAASCRLLELGCGDGGNLIPMALGLPGSRFVGIDVAEKALSQGQDRIKALNLENIELQRLDVMEFTGEEKAFDYIVAHGLFSWVPPAVQERIFEICRRHLAPQGVAYISYNVYPGCRLRMMAREMMLSHVSQFDDPKERILQAKAFLDFLADSRDKPDLYLRILQEERKSILDYGDHALFHDDIAEINAPVYFHEFMKAAARHGMQFLAESDLSEMVDQVFPPRVREWLRRFEDDVVEKEQYRDFFKGRKFRQTLLCRKGVPLNRAPEWDRMKLFSFASRARSSESEPDFSPETEMEFKGRSGAFLKTAHPLAKAVVYLLGRTYPRQLPFQDLLLETGDLLNLAAPDPSEAELGKILMATSMSGLVELHRHRPEFALEAGERPVASPLARLQAESASTVASLRHTDVELETDLSRHLLTLLDGTRDRSELLRLMVRRVAVEKPGPRESELSETLENTLGYFAREALLIA